MNEARLLFLKYVIYQVKNKLITNNDDLNNNAKLKRRRLTYQKTSKQIHIDVLQKEIIMRLNGKDWIEMKIRHPFQIKHLRFLVKMTTMTVTS